jgi:hypothetical protein
MALRCAREKKSPAQTKKVGVAAGLFTSPSAIGYLW